MFIIDVIQYDELFYCFSSEMDLTMVICFVFGLFIYLYTKKNVFVFVCFNYTLLYYIDTNGIDMFFFVFLMWWIRVGVYKVGSKVCLVHIYGVLGALFSLSYSLAFNSNQVNWTRQNKTKQKKNIIIIDCVFPPWCYYLYVKKIKEKRMLIQRNSFIHSLLLLLLFLIVE